MKTSIIEKNGRTFQVEATAMGSWEYKVDVYELFENGKFAFCGKAISNDVMVAFESIIK